MKTLGTRLWPAFLVGAVLLVFISGTVVGVSQVRGPSMQPNYHNGQIILINRWAYGLQFPIIGGYSWFWKAPMVGDIVILRNPSDGQMIIKRVAGVGGMPLRVKDQQLFIGQRRVPLSAWQAYWLEAVPHVPAHTIFVLGDNPAQSYDSRDWGFAKETSVVGKLWN
ncbi:MAG: signal peptidase I [Spirochaetales bacterium]|nr:signal peptidase I [Spirochaetales bacterium]